MNVKWRDNINVGVGLGVGAFVFGSDPTLSEALLWGAYMTLCLSAFDCCYYFLKRLFYNNRNTEMQETQHKVTGEMRQEFFSAQNQKLLNQQMDDRLKELPDERLVRRVKIGRNQPCPCGSGRKFKKCCITGLRSR